MMPPDAKASVVQAKKKIAILPFSTKRTNGTSGPIARQIPFLIAGALEASGREVDQVTWVAQRGTTRAYVLAEGVLPETTVLGEMSARGCDAGISGRVLWEDGLWKINVTLHAQDEDAVELVSDESRELAPLIEAAVAAVMQHEKISNFDDVALPATEPALRSWLCDLDAWALVECYDIDALVDVEHAWKHLVDVLDLDPNFEPARKALDARIARWRRDGLTRLVAGATMARARTTHRSEDWAAAARDAESMGDEDGSESALRGLLADTPSENSALLKLGVLLVRQSRNSEAIAYLRDALRYDDVRDLAETYLGVALASTGDLEKAVEHWQNVVTEGNDDRAKRIARENLARARSQ